MADSNTNIQGMIDAVNVSMNTYEKALDDLFKTANNGANPNSNQPMDISSATIGTTKVQLAQATSELVRGTVDNAVKHIAKLGQKMQGG